MLDLKSTSMRLHSISPSHRKVSPLKTQEKEYPKDRSLERYKELVPMKALNSLRTKRPNPLHIYYKNIDVVRPKRKENLNKITLPPVKEFFLYV